MQNSGHQSAPPDSDKVKRAVDHLLKIDPYLKPYEKIIARRLSKIETMEKRPLADMFEQWVALCRELGEDTCLHFP